jgi:periplasmic protein TonB
MQAAFANRAPERRMSAAFAIAIHVAMLALLLSFRPQFSLPAEPAPPLAVDLVPAPPPEAPVVEPKPIEEEPARTSSTLSLQRPGGSESAPPAPRELREDMDRTITPFAAPAFPSGPAPATGIAPDGVAGTGRAGNGDGTGAGGRGTGTGTGTGSGSGPGSRPGASSQEVALTPPRWIRKPTFRQMEMYNPPRAIGERVSGTAILACRVDSGRRARRCRILSETPRGYGFGTAALNTVRLGRIDPAMRGGLPDYKAWVRIPVTFRNCAAGEPACVNSLD